MLPYIEQYIFGTVFACVCGIVVGGLRLRGKWGKVMTRGKMIFQSTVLNIQMASFDK